MAYHDHHLVMSFCSLDTVTVVPTSKSTLVRDVDYLKLFIILHRLSSEHATTLIDAYLKGGDLSHTKLPCGFIAAPRRDGCDEHLQMWGCFTEGVNDAASASVSDGGGSIIHDDELPTAVDEPMDDVALDVASTSGDGGDEDRTSTCAKGQRFTFDSPSKAAEVALTSDEPPPPSRTDLEKMSAERLATFTRSMWKSKQDAHAGMVQMCETLRTSSPDEFASLYKTVLRKKFEDSIKDPSTRIATVHACLT